MTSLARLPTITSLPGVPTIVARLPAQEGAAAAVAGSANARSARRIGVRYLAENIGVYRFGHVRRAAFTTGRWPRWSEALFRYRQGRGGHKPEHSLRPELRRLRRCSQGPKGLRLSGIDAIRGPGDDRPVRRSCATAVATVFLAAAWFAPA